MAKKKRKDKKGKKRKGGFKYRTRSRESWEKRSEQSGFNRRSMFADAVKVFRPKEDDNLIRILPPTFEDADHYGHEIFVHYSIGPDKDSILCRNKMLGEACPVCEERSRALGENDKEYADKLNPKKRVCIYLVDRDDEDTGLQLWSMPWTLDADVTTLAIDKRSGEVLDIDDPDDGYDIEFTKTGKGMNTKYVGVAIARKSSALDNSEVLEDAVETPLTETLVYLEYEDIDKLFNGGAGMHDDEDDDDDERKRGKSKKDKKGKKKSKKDKSPKKKKKAEPPTWEQVQEMDLDELEEVVDEQGLDCDVDIDDDDEDELDELRTEVCGELDLKKPKKRKAKKKEKEKIRKRKRK